MKKSLIVLLIIPVVIIFFGWLGYSLYDADDDRPSVSGVTNDVVVKSVQAERVDAEAVEPPAKPSNVNRVLQYKSWNEADSSTDARACFSFATEIDAGDRVDLRDYVSISPETSFSLSINQNQICISGFAYDETYQVTLKQGLPDKGDRKLDRNITETISFGDKPAYVGFAGEGIILPRVNAQGLAIETVNVDAVTVEIARVPDRMIARRDPQSGRATLEGEYGWEYQDAATSIRETVWTGEVEVQSIKNKTITTVLPIHTYIEDLKPGAYVITVERDHEPDERQIARAWRWIISTDLALTSYRSDDGLTVSVRSIDSAQLQPETEVVLVSRNNDILAKEKTDSAGYVTFPGALLKGNGPKAAKMLMAYGKNSDYAVLDLNRPPLDLSEHDIAGRSVSGPIDIYGFPERGVYRPGETAHFTILQRDLNGYAATDTPATLTVFKPGGLEMLKTRIEKQDISQHAGTITWSYDVPRSAPRGVWSVFVKPDGMNTGHRIEFSVEDFVPQKLRLGLKADENPIRPGEIRDITLDAQFLYGAPGAALEAEAEARLRIDPNPFPDFKSYSFGPAQRDFEERLIDMGGGLTDGAGALVLALDAKNEDLTSPFPLRAEITAGVSEPGGRYIRDSLRIPVRSADTYLGIKPEFEGKRVRRGQPAKFDFIAVNHDGVRTAKEIKWTLIEEDWQYSWYRESGRWRYRYDVRDIVLDGGQTSIAADQTQNWSQRLKWGNYRLEVETEDGAKSGYRFSVGWGQTNRSDAPDRLQIGLSENKVRAGDMINLSVNAPYAGEAELVIANSEVKMVRPISLKAGASELSFKFDPRWGSGVYAMMTLYTPRDETNLPVPRRAVGMSYVELDRSDQTLVLDIESPDVLRPGTEQTFTINVDGASRSDRTWLNFAAVDEGILQITKYSSPDAAKVFFGKPALGMEIRDDYGRILNPNLGTPAAVRSGGDSLGGEGLTVVPTKTVAMFSGPVAVKNGYATVTLEMPEFNGELRLMATAWSQSSVGSASRAVKLRDKVPALVGLPRFLAPGDKAFATVSLDNVEGQPGAYKAALLGGDAMAVSDSVSFELTQGQRLDDRVPISANGTGITDIELTVSGPDYEKSARYPFQVRSPYIPITRVERSILEPGKALSLSESLIAEFVPGSADVTVSFSRLPGLDPTPYVKSLARYPYGCSEQTVSSAMPLLYAGNLGGIPGQTDFERRRGVKQAISRLSSRQSSDGAFGLWREGDRNSRPWLGVYITDFLFRAQDEGFYVSESVLERASKATREISQMPRYMNVGYRYWQNADNRWVTRQKAEAAAYAHYMLARTGQGNLGQMRYFYDNHSDKIRSPLAKAYIASALAMMGDKRRTDPALKSVTDAIGFEDNDDYYQSSVRDIAGALAALSAAKQNETVIALSEPLVSALDDENYLHTNEKAHAIMALNAMLEKGDPIKISVKGTKLSGSDHRKIAHLYGSDLVNAPSFTNKDKSSIWASVSVEGSPIEAPKPISNGLTLTKTLHHMDGRAANPNTVSQGQRYIVKLGFNSDIRRSRTVVLADLLPAGFEIETVLEPADAVPEDGAKGAYAWLGRLSEFQVIEARDDRFVASLETYRKDKYAAAYIVRAVTAGEFSMPGAVLEDMYRPQDVAITSATRLKIAADPAL